MRRKGIGAVGKMPDFHDYKNKRIGENMDKKDTEIYTLVQHYLEKYINDPIQNFLERDPIGFLKISTQVVLLNLIYENIINSSEIIDKSKFEYLEYSKKDEYLKELGNYLRTGKESETVNKPFDILLVDKEFIPYLFRELNWILISLLSSSYVSVHILIRCVFESIIKFLTKNKNAGMADKISGISILTDKNKKFLKKYWNRLNSWAHPYDHWIKKICPIYIMHKPIYHKELFIDCLNDLHILFELLIIMSVKIFNVSENEYKKKLLKGIELFDYYLIDKDIFCR
jgi:hypothetical protein